MTFKDYYDQARIAYDALEEATEDTITEDDEGVGELGWLWAINEARREVMDEAISANRRWVARREEFVYSGAVNLTPPDAVLAYAPLSISLVEEKLGGTWLKLDALGLDDREQHQLGGLGRSASAGYLFDGASFELLPEQSAGRTVRITYVPEPEPLTRADLTRQQTDLALPLAVHFAVPIRTAMNAAVKDADRRDALAVKWEEARRDILRRSRLRDTSTARYPKMTRPRLGVPRA